MAQFNNTTINTTNTAKAVMDWLDPIMTTQGWTFVETWTSSTKTANVYKSPAASNSVNSDFYMSFYRTADNANIVYVLLFEDWDAVNKKARKYAPASGAGITVNPADNTVTDATGVLLDSATLNQTAYFSTAPSTQITIYVDININRVIWGTTVVGGYSTNSGYCGIFQSALPASIDPVPLVLCKATGANGASSSTGATTREPGAPAAATNNFRITVYDNGLKTYAHTPLQVQSAAVFPNQDIYLGQIATRIQFISNRAYGVGGSPLLIRGIFDGPITALSGGAVGDTLTATTFDGSVRHYVLTSVYSSNSTVQWFVRTS